MSSATLATLVIQSDSVLGQALKLVCPPSSTACAIRLIEKKSSSLNSSSSVNCIATSLGAAFVYLDSPVDAVPPQSSSFRLTVFIVNLSKTNKKLLSELSAYDRSYITLAHNAEEAAEFVVSFVTKLTDSRALEQARNWIEESTRITKDPKEQAFAIAERGFPGLAATESRALMESVGSFVDLARLQSAREIANQTPLSDRDAERVATVMGMATLMPRQQEEDVNMMVPDVDGARMMEVMMTTTRSKIKIGGRTNIARML